MIGIIDYGSGNVFAIANIYKMLNLEYIISNKHEDLAKSSHLILPGVGAFDETMSTLKSSGLQNFLDEQVLIDKKPVMGVCVGMQILAENSEEGSLEGLGWIKGTVKKFDSIIFKQKPYLPHLGWNEIEINKNSTIFENIDPKQGFYFLHSYYFSCENESDTLATTDYGIKFSSAVNHENIYGMQFHPEKSHRNGIELLHNFYKIK